MNFEVWRLFTCFVFFGPFSMGFAFNLYLLYNYSNAYETSPFSSDGSSRTDSTSADYCYMLMVGASLLLMISYFLPQMILGPALVFTIVYVWSRRHPESAVCHVRIQISGSISPVGVLRILYHHRKITHHESHGYCSGAHLLLYAANCSRHVRFRCNSNQSLIDVQCWTVLIFILRIRKSSSW